MPVPTGGRCTHIGAGRGMRGKAVGNGPANKDHAIPTSTRFRAPKPLEELPRTGQVSVGIARRTHAAYDFAETKPELRVAGPQSAPGVASRLCAQRLSAILGPMPTLFRFVAVPCISSAAEPEHAPFASRTGLTSLNVPTTLVLQALAMVRHLSVMGLAGFVIKTNTPVDGFGLGHAGP